MAAGLSLDVRHLLAVIADGDLPPPVRAAAGRELASLGDPRPGVGVRPDGVPDLRWVRLPAGACCHQQAESITLPAFEIARYPVTCAQVQAFVDAADGFADDRWWRGLAVRDAEPPASAPGRANYPCEDVSWCAAVAFCRWLSAATGTRVRLPTEQEWERTARGAAGRCYPWGDSYLSGAANLNEPAARLGPYRQDSTTAVGIYPAGDSPEGASDLIGGVWEWCLNEFCDRDQTGVEGGAPRVMRGGSWACSPREVNALTRELDLPDYGYVGVGFRVVRIFDQDR